MRIKLIACDVFARMAYAAAAVSEHRVDLELLPMLSHNEPDKLRKELQDAIDKCKNACVEGYDKIILAYGLCGNAAAGLTASIPMIIPRMHDCCAMFLGSRKKFLEHFEHRLSAQWRSCGYMERCASVMPNYKLHPDYLKLVEEYDEENAEYIWQTMNPPSETDEDIYIRVEGFEYGGTYESFVAQKAEEGRTVEVLEGDGEWFSRLVNGPWSNEDFLEILPGNEIVPIYDMDEVYKSDKGVAK